MKKIAKVTKLLKMLKVIKIRKLSEKNTQMRMRIRKNIKYCVQIIRQQRRKITEKEFKINQICRNNTFRLRNEIAEKYKNVNKKNNDNNNYYYHTDNNDDNNSNDCNNNNNNNKNNDK